MNNFIDNCRQLVNSLVIKDTNIGLTFYKKLYTEKKAKYEEVMRQVALLNGSYDIQDRDFLETLNNNKYYANITGKQVEDYDTPIKFKILENDEWHIFDIETLTKFVDTKKEVLKCSDFYKNLLRDNIEYIDYIHGVMYPSDIITAYKKNNGEILSYNPNFLEPQEAYLIEELNKYTQKFLGMGLPMSYANNNPLFIPAYHFILRTYLYNYVIEQRLSKMNTMYAHSFLVKVKLSSKLDIYNEISNFKSETIMWTYRNIDRLMAHAGTNFAFEQLLNTILDANGVGIGSYVCRRDDISLATGEEYKNRYDFQEAPMHIPEPRIVPYPLNNSFVISKDTTISLEDVDKQLISSYKDFSMSPIKENTAYEVEMNKEKIVREYANEFDTKVIEISTLTEYTSFNFDIFKTILDYWAYFVNNDLYGSITKDKKSMLVDFVDPNTKNIFTLDATKGYKFAIYLLCKAAGLKGVDEGMFKYSNVISSDKPFIEIIRRTLIEDGYTERLVDELGRLYPGEFKETASVSVVGDYLERMIKFMQTYWLYVSNVENGVTSSNLYKLMQDISIEDKVRVATKPGYVTLEDLEIEIGTTITGIEGQYNYSATLNELFRTVLGVSVSNEIRVAELLKGYRSLITKMTSYTVDVIGNTSNLNVINVNYQHLGPMFSKKGVLMLKEDKLSGKPLEQYWHAAKFDTYEPVEKARIYNHLEKAKVSSCHRAKNVFYHVPDDEARPQLGGVRIEALN